MEKKYKPVFDAFYKFLNNHLKDTSKEIPCRSLHERTQEFIEKLSMPLFKNYAEATTKEKRAELMANCFLFDGFVNDLNKKLPHVFVANENLMQFFKSVDFSDFELLRSFAEKNEKLFAEDKQINDIFKYLYDVSLVFSEKNLEENFTPFDFNVSYYALHSKEKSYFISTSRENDSSSDKNMVLTIFDDQDNFSYIPLVKTKKSLEFIKNNELIRIGLNFLSYCKAFPECLIDGVPQSLSKEEKKRNSNCKILNTSTQIIENIEDIKSGKVVTPHFRKGHFRLLSDDRFVNKKGQVVFVKATMVKGQAQTLKNKKAKDEIGRGY